MHGPEQSVRMGLASFVGLLLTLVPGCHSGKPALNEDVLMNMEYRSLFAAQGVVGLEDGGYAEAGVAGASSSVVVSLENYAIGQVNGVPMAAVILQSRSGGTGVFYDLAVVMERDGAIVNTDHEFVGDRVKIRGVEIHDGAIVVQMVTHGSAEPLCCPTVSWRQRYEVQEGRVVRPGP